MELLKFSKFKIQLQALIAEVRQLRERERSTREELRLLIQKQKQSEEELVRRVQDLQAELVSSNELREKLERKMSYLQNDNALLENKQRELNGTIQNLLQSRENFVSVYEDSTCEMKRSIETRDRKLAILSQKINAHILLFDSIEKEASSVKQVVNNVQRLVSEKEEVVAGLKSKVEKVSAFEKVFFEKISDLQNKLRNNEEELQRKDKIISEIEVKLEAANVGNNWQQHIEELQKSLSAKDAVIQNLLSEKQALHFEVGCLGIVLQKIQDAVTNMNEKDKRVFSSILEGQEVCAMETTKEYSRIDEVVQGSRETSPHKASEEDVNTASPVSQKNNPVSNAVLENKNFDSCVSESACLEPQLEANIPCISANGAKDNNTASVYHLDSESSTTQAET
ncbi:hyaluronan mediated motility receptor isoform X2 [Vitis riparia]|uniref:hyaluronan mediated motility receptor isoform X2 n=1 Tax=Vitis riparia TaxID=96939 RepID=UPI00155A393A|nr:hyaluronan mediated motility receptor isoform X2 [Vitis riparia]